MGNIREEDQVIVYYDVGIFKNDPNRFGYENIDMDRAQILLSEAFPKFKTGDIIAMDGLKWKKAAGRWEPFPNPPKPILEPGEDVDKHLKEYAKWSHDHPHFGLPPMPPICSGIPQAGYRVNSVGSAPILPPFPPSLSVK